jgi:hypothetical protein
VLSIARRAFAEEIRDLNRERRRQTRMREQVAIEESGRDIGDSVTLWASVATLDFDRRAVFVLT